MSGFNPSNEASTDSGIFGLDDSYENSKLIYLPVPWEATTSYGNGTSNGPSSILKASHQLDLYDSEYGRVYEAGLHLQKEDPEIRTWNTEAKSLVQSSKNKDRVNELSTILNKNVYNSSKKILDDGKILGLIGGDHSTPLGAYQAISEKEKEFGFLHFDAHFDLRKAYQGYTHSHASIFYNAMSSIREVEKIVHVGIRDFCEEELDYANEHSDRHSYFLDSTLSHEKLKGVSWERLTQKIIEPLPEKVWISFDIDGLDPKYCPNTGTPVPGGLSFNEACFLINQLSQSKRKIIGFDLCEVAPSPQNSNEWDANVGMRLLYKLTGATLSSNR